MNTSNHSDIIHSKDPVYNRRAYVVVICVVAIVILIIARLFFLQIIDGSLYRNKADRVYSGKVASVSDRGDIVMVGRSGMRVQLAGQLQVYKLYIEPKAVVDEPSVLQSIQRAVPGFNQSQLHDIVTKNKSYTLPEQYTKSEIETLFTSEFSKIETPRGLRIGTESIRKYSGNSLAAHITGFVGFVGDKLEGRYGLEKQYDDELRAHDSKLYSNFFVELFSTIIPKWTTSHSLQNAGQATLVTTLEPEVQKRVESTLQSIQDKWQSEESGIIIMNPKTGAIIAMAANPTFDINNFRNVDNASVFTNPITQKVYEVGSIMKPLIMAYAFENGIVTPTTTYTDTGSIKVDDRTIYNFDKKARGTVDMQQVLIQSLNTGMVTIMNKMDRKKVRSYFEDLGLREKSGIDLPYESRGLTSNLDTLRRVEYANIAFGQGLAIPPIAMMRALSLLANGGVLVQPHIVQSLEYPYGDMVVVNSEALKNRRQVLRPETVSSIASIMTKLVDVNFKSNPYYMPHYSVAAKTGTAQMSKPTGGYYTDRNLHSFFGFFPAHNPQFSVYMFTANPKGAKYSAETLSGPFLQMTQFLINYYNIPPDRGIASLSSNLPLATKTVATKKLIKP